MHEFLHHRTLAEMEKRVVKTGQRLLDERWLTHLQERLAEELASICDSLSVGQEVSLVKSIGIDTPLTLTSTVDFVTRRSSSVNVLAIKLRLKTLLRKKSVGLGIIRNRSQSGQM